MTDNLATWVLGPMYRSEAERYIASLTRPEPAIDTSAITALTADVLALINSPVAVTQRDWEARQSHLLKAASLWSQQPPVGLAPAVFQRTIEILNSVTGLAAEQLIAHRPEELTAEDALTVKNMVRELMPVGQGSPDDEARSWIVDMVAVWFFAPCTEVIDQAGDEDAMALVSTELEKAFSAAEYAGKLWDQANADE